jgi:hypothetical protein
MKQELFDEIVDEANRRYGSELRSRAHFDAALAALTSNESDDVEYTAEEKEKIVLALAPVYEEE